MKKVATALTLVGAAFSLTLATGSAQAQATRTWVSGVGDDANPCSRTAPCKTFAGAISKTATNGEISVLDPGGFGQVTITKAITLNGDGTLAGILAAGVTGIIINAPSTADILIRNLSINGTAPNGTSPGITGIRFIAGGTLTVQNSNIYGFNTSCIDVAITSGGPVTNIVDTNLASCVTGISVSNTAASQRSSVNVSRSKITDTTTGINGSRQANIALDNVVIAGAGTGVAITSGGFAPASEVNINLGMIAMSGLGLQINSGATARLNGVYFSANGKAMDNQGACETANNNRLGGNVNGNTGAACTALSTF